MFRNTCFKERLHTHITSKTVDISRLAPDFLTFFLIISLNSLEKGTQLLVAT
jgi:hypothetical protein